MHITVKIDDPCSTPLKTFVVIWVWMWQRKPSRDKTVTASYKTIYRRFTMNSEVRGVGEVYWEDFVCGNCHRITTAYENWDQWSSSSKRAWVTFRWTSTTFEFVTQSCGAKFVPSKYVHENYTNFRENSLKLQLHIFHGVLVFYAALDDN